eukprot:scaffold64375_cov59-Phaeocystis_antarctica.AAC.2
MQSPLIHLPPRRTLGSVALKLTTSEVGCRFVTTPSKPLLPPRLASTRSSCSRRACANAASVPMPPNAPRRLASSPAPLCLRASAKLRSGCSFRISRKVSRPAHISYTLVAGPARAASPWPRGTNDARNMAVLAMATLPMPARPSTRRRRRSR